MKYLKQPLTRRDKRGHMTIEWANWYMKQMYGIDLYKVNDVISKARAILSGKPIVDRDSQEIDWGPAVEDIIEEPANEL